MYTLSRPQGKAGSGIFTNARSETLVCAQIAPLPRRQVAEAHAPDAYPLQSGDFQADQLAHAADLPLAAIAQDEAQLVGVLPPDPGRAQFLAVE